MKNSQIDHKFFLEALLLYIILFFSPALAAFSTANGDLQRILLYSLPSLALLWHIISGRRGFSALKKEKVAKKDLVSLVLSLAGLLLIALLLSFLVEVLSREYQNSIEVNLPPTITLPQSFLHWIVVFISCLFTGYLEESYFRYYLLGVMEEHLKSKLMRVFFSVLLFAFCHSYAGAFSIVNAVLSGTLLSLVFLRFRSLHGIAMAHALYNFSVYLLAALV